jgi:hypothetical protein
MKDFVLCIVGQLLRNHKDFSWAIILSSQVHQTPATGSIDSLIQIAVISSHHPEQKLFKSQIRFLQGANHNFSPYSTALEIASSAP